MTALLGMLAGNAELPIPLLTGQSGTFLVGHLITVLPAATLMYGLSRGDARLEAVACRPMGPWNAMLGLAAAAAGGTVAALLYLATNSPISLVLGRNTIGYIGCALLASVLVGPRFAAPLTAVLPLLCAATGWRQGGQPEPWAWILQPPHSTIGAAAALLLLALGVAATAAGTSLSRASGQGR
ncbi:hypothetical protein ACFQVC_40945 [Streptomyces monticola]|uniref:ABC transporter permease n=1 Tax=Streptomyces monticola TaxID=2666263 RepID=A0ABW2JYH4_9ACTN